jgi:TonB family protein
MQIEARPSEWMRPRDVGRVVTHAGPKGLPGNPTKPVPGVRAERDSPSPGQFGESGNDLVARAIASRGQVPVMTSTELIIEELVPPVIPEELRRREIDVHVSVLALVDTLGNVSEAQVINPSGLDALDEALRVAVLRSRFRPYRKNGKQKMIYYAVFPFWFH